MEIADYIPIYPELTDPDFNNDVYHKKEFYDLRTTSGPQPFGKPGDLWSHQKLLARFFSPHTPYNEMLLFHTPGTGKTCAASAIVEINKQDPTLRKPVLVVVPNESLAEQWKQQIAFICTSGEYIPEHYYSADPETRLTEAKKTTRLNKLIRPVYNLETMDKMSRKIEKNLRKKNIEFLRKEYSNTIIIIDEAHNLRIQTNVDKDTAEKSKGRYDAFYNLLHIVTNSKILLLSGTPLYDSITELPGLMNLILPMNKQLPTGKAFSKEFLKRVEGLRMIKNKEELYEALVGRVSYIREGGNFPKRIDLGKEYWTKYIKTINLKMSPEQVAGYQLAYGKDTQKDKSGGLWKNTRQAAVFVYQGLWGKAAWDKLVYQKPLLIRKKISEITKKEDTVELKPGLAVIDGQKIRFNVSYIKPEYRKELQENLGNYSAKYKHIVDYVQSKPTNPVFIFTPLVSGAGGAIFLGRILELFGYIQAHGNEKGVGKRYAIITGEDTSSLQRKALINMYNSPDNRKGELIQIMIATKTISEGTSFLNVKDVIVVSPYWNNSGTEQAIGRGLRANSLSYLAPEKRTVTVQELAVISKNIPTDENIDARLYKLSETKDYEIKIGERVLKEIAWDCPLNYDRNVRAIDDNYSRSCDYQKCNYVCYQTNPKKVKPVWKYELQEDTLDDSTFILYYRSEEIQTIIERLKEKLQMYSYVDIRGLDELMGVDNFKLLILAIEYIIENHVTVYNKWGQSCFLHNQGNILFLSETPNEKDVRSAWYACFPYVNQNIPLSQIINNELLSSDLAKLEKLDLTNKAVAQKIINDLALSSQIFILEHLIQLDESELTSQQKKLLKLFKSLFSTHIFTIEETIVHDLAKTVLDRDCVDYNIGKTGSLRCYDGDIWRDCDKKETQEFSKIIGDTKKEQYTDIVDNPYKLYATIETDGQFRIVDKLAEEQKKKKSKGSTDRRIKYRGKVCMRGWTKVDLIKLYLRVNAMPVGGVNTKITQKGELLDKIKKAGLEQVVPEKPTTTILQKIYTLALQGKPDICNGMQRWFEEKGLIIKS